MMKRIIAMIAAVAMLLCLAGCKNDADKNNDGEKVNVEEKVLQSENFSFDLGEATYLFERYFIDFYNNNAQYISFYGIDIEKSLKEQEYTKDVTWFDYFAEQAETYMNELLVFCEAAKASGKELDENDVAEIDSIIKEFEDEAEADLIGKLFEAIDILDIDTCEMLVQSWKEAYQA